MRVVLAARAYLPYWADCVGAADEGRAALELCARREPDVLALGDALRGMDAFYVIRALREARLSLMPAVLWVSLRGAPMPEGACAETTPDKLADALDRMNPVSPRDRLLPACEKDIERALSAFGIPMRLRGRETLARALSYTIRDASLCGALATRLYPMVGEDTGVSASATEKRIRSAIESAWQKPRYDWFGNVIDPARGMPTNGEFIARITEAIRYGQT